MAKITIEQAMALIEQKVTEAMRETIKTTAAPMIQRTPVRSGNAKGNWNTTKNSPSSKVVVSRDTSGQNAIRELNAVVDTSKPGQHVFVVNNVSYIGTLERGNAQRTATGMRAMARAEFKAKAEIAAAKVRNS